MDLTVGELLTALYGPGGVIALFVYISILMIRGDLVFGRELRAAERRNGILEQEAQELRQAGLRALLTAQEGRDLSHKVLHELAHSPTESGPS